MCMYWRWKSASGARALGSWSMRWACSRRVSGVSRRPCEAAVNSSASGMLSHKRYESREAISKLLSEKYTPLESPANSGRIKNEGDIRNTSSINCTASPKVPFSVSSSRSV